MRTIYKYPIPIADSFTLDLPAGARVLTVQEQHGTATLWALVDSTLPTEPRHFRLAGTGHPLDGDGGLAYVGSIQQHGGWVVRHLFEAGEQAG